MDKSKALSSLRCPHCAGPLSKEMETSSWTVPPLIRDSFSMIGSAVGGTTSAFYGFNYGEHNCIGCVCVFPLCVVSILSSATPTKLCLVMPTVRKYVKGPMWLHFLIGAPPVIVFSSACAGIAGGAVPALAQLASSSYHASMSALSPATSHDEESHKSRTSSTL